MNVSWSRVPKIHLYSAQTLQFSLVPIKGQDYQCIDRYTVPGPDPVPLIACHGLLQRSLVPNIRGPKYPASRITSAHPWSRIPEVHDYQCTSCTWLQGLYPTCKLGNPISVELLKTTKYICVIYLRPSFLFLSCFLSVACCTYLA
jgi:hypothetical protein